MADKLAFHRVLPQPAARRNEPPASPAESGQQHRSTACGSGIATIDCSHCKVRALCLPGGMNDSECADFEHLVVRRHQLARAEVFRQMGEPAHGKLYAVHSGQLKCYQVSHAGEQRITALPAAGDLIGLDLICNTLHPTAVAANCPSILCEFNYAQLLSASRQFKPLARRLELFLSKELARQQAVSLMLRAPRAEQKLAAFLLQTAWMATRRGEDGVRLDLQLSRRDIGDYLGITDATIARLLQRFIRTGCIAVSRRRITLLDYARLRDIARGDCTASPAGALHGEPA